MQLTKGTVGSDPLLRLNELVLRAALIDLLLCQCWNVELAAAKQGASFKESILASECHPESERLVPGLGLGSDASIPLGSVGPLTLVQ